MYAGYYNKQKSREYLLYSLALIRILISDNVGN